MSSLKNFLHGIADDMGRPRDSMNPVIQIFEDNWYDTVESIQALDDEALAKMKVPMRIIEIIRKKLGGNTTQSKQPEKMIQEESKSNAQTAEEQALMSNQMSKFSFTLDQLKREIIKPQSLLDVVNILEKVVGNLLKDSKNETFRTLKLTNEKLKEKLFAYRGVFDVLSLVGFNQKDDILYISESEINFALIKQMHKEIETLKQKTIERQAFDPYKSSFSSTTDVNMANIAGQSGPTSYDFGLKLEELKMKRRNAAKPYIENKEVKVFVLDQNTSIQSFLSTRDQTLEEEDTRAEELLFRQEIMRMAKEFEANSNFTSRRKKEFEQLLKEPLYTECRIRVKFPDHSILEAKFSPREPLKNIVEVVRKYLVDPKWNFYLFQTPPVQKITPQNWSRSLEEADMVPNMLLYFGTDQPLQGVKEYLTIKPEHRS